MASQDTQQGDTGQQNLESDIASGGLDEAVSQSGEK